MIIRSLFSKTCFWIFFICLSTASVHAATITHHQSWSLFSGPNDAPVQEMRSIDMFDPSLGTLTQVDWTADAGINAIFSTPPSSLPIDYGLGAGIACSVSIPLAGTFGCDLLSPTSQGDVRNGTTRPISGPVGINESIPLVYSGSPTFIDPIDLAVFIGTTPMDILLQVDTFAQAETCVFNPISQQVECLPVPVTFSGDYTGTLSVTYTFDPVPIPAAIWLFSSGLIGLIGIARKRKP